MLSVVMLSEASVASHLSYLMHNLIGDIYPTWVAVTCDLYPHERVEGPLVDTVVTMAYDGAVDLF